MQANALCRTEEEILANYGESSVNPCRALTDRFEVDLPL
jgi:hypothetical protein